MGGRRGAWVDGCLEGQMLGVGIWKGIWAVEGWAEGGVDGRVDGWTVEGLDGTSGVGYMGNRAKDGRMGWVVWIDGRTDG